MLPKISEQIGEHETKFVLPNNRSHIIISWLQKKCLPDPQFAVGKVSSIYYDSRDWVSLGEKLNSDYLKTKVRLRWYSDSNTDTLFPPVFLEIKSKIGSARKKVRIETGIESRKIVSTPLNNFKFLSFPDLAREKGISFEKTLFPTFQLNYDRHRFIDPMSGSRLCVDRNIHVSRVNPIMINRTNPAFLKDGVFELKGKNGELPDWLHQLTSLGCRRGAFSKYSCCYQQLKRKIY